LPGTGAGGGAFCDHTLTLSWGVFARIGADLAPPPGSSAYRAYLVRQADSVWAKDRDPLNRLGQRWAGGSPNQVDWRTQASALAALTGAG
ncbi:glycosyl hydrolase, partial [Streptomyces griseoluteus]